MDDPNAARPDLRSRVLGGVLWFVARCIGLTLRVRYENYHVLDELHRSSKGLVMITWHGRTLIPANIYRGRGFWVLISLSRDGWMQNCIFRRFGFQVVRGSTGRGGVRAALQLARIISDGGVLAFTPDGPRGPTHKVQQGTLFIAQRAGCPIVPVGISARPRLLVGSWDRYMVPAPFARATFVVGEPVCVPKDADDAAKEQIASELEVALNRVEKRAEELLGLPYPAEFPT